MGRLEDEVSILRKENILLSEREKNKEKLLREKENQVQNINYEKTKLDRDLTQHEIRIIELEKGYETEKKKRENYESENDGLLERNRNLKSNYDKLLLEKEAINAKLQEKIKKENELKERFIKFKFIYFNFFFFFLRLQTK